MTRIRTFRGRAVLVTGAAGGIGRAVARAVAADDGRLVLTDIDAAGLRETAAVITATGATVLVAEPADIADHDAVRRLAERVTAEHGAMDVVMNIAGISAWGTVSALPHETWRRLVEVNLMGPIHVIEEFVPAMVDAVRRGARDGGHLVNVSSAAGIIGMPWHAAYSASKFGLRGVSEVLRFDLGRHGIGVSLVCPGAVATPLTETVSIAGVDRESPRFRRSRATFRKYAATPERAADAILTGVRRNRYWVYTSFDIRLIHAVQRFCPPAYALAMRVLSAQANRIMPEVERARRPA